MYKEEYYNFIEKSLMDLLCYIHRDGGHYIGEHGLEKAVKDGINIVCDLIHDRKENCKEK